MAFLRHCSTNGKLRILVKAQPPPQAPGHCHQLGLAYGRKTWVYPTNTLSATVAFLLLPGTNLLPQAGISHTSSHRKLGKQGPSVSSNQLAQKAFKLILYMQKSFSDLTISFTSRNRAQPWVQRWHLPMPTFSLPSNNQFIIKLVKMWPGETPHVVVGTLKISLDQLKKSTKSLLECCQVSNCEVYADRKWGKSPSIWTVNDL